MNYMDQMKLRVFLISIQPSTWSVPSPVVLQSQNKVKFYRDSRASTGDIVTGLRSCFALVLRSLSPVFRAVSVLSGIFLASWLWSVSRCSRPIELRFCVWRCSLFLCLVVRSPVWWNYLEVNLCAPFSLPAVLYGEVTCLLSNPWSSWWYHLMVHCELVCWMTSWMNSNLLQLWQCCFFLPIMAEYLAPTWKLTSGLFSRIGQKAG